MNNIKNNLIVNMKSLRTGAVTGIPMITTGLILLLINILNYHILYFYFMAIVAIVDGFGMWADNRLIRTLGTIGTFGMLFVLYMYVFHWNV